MENPNQPMLPWDEIIERLYHRQDPSDILKDLVERKRIQTEDLSEVLSMISNMKAKIESFRLKN
jgi:hypothetical protein